MPAPSSASSSAMKMRCGHLVRCPPPRCPLLRVEASAAPASASASDAPPSPAAAPVDASLSAFDDIAAGTERKYIMVSGKGGVGKTSLSASLAVALAAAGHSTLVVSTDPAHSLSDSLDQDVSGGRPVPVEGTDLPLWGLEIDPDAARLEWSAAASKDGGAGIKNVLGGFGLGMLADQLADLKLGELLDSPPPGLDEAVAIAKVVEIAQSEKYARFSRVVVDTAPTGETLFSLLLRVLLRSLSSSEVLVFPLLPALDALLLLLLRDRGAEASSPASSPSFSSLFSFKKLPSIIPPPKKKQATPCAFSASRTSSTPPSSRPPTSAASSPRPDPPCAPCSAPPSSRTRPSPRSRSCAPAYRSPASSSETRSRPSSSSRPCPRSSPSRNPAGCSRPSGPTACPASA